MDTHHGRPGSPALLPLRPAGLYVEMYGAALSSLIRGSVDQEFVVPMCPDL